MAETTASRALQYRLDSDTLTPQDKERLALAREFRRLRKQGKSLPVCAEELGVKLRMLQKFNESNSFRVLSTYCERLETGVEDVATEKVVRKAKQEFAGFAPDTIDYYRSCFIRNAPEDQEEKGIFKDDSKAMWAAERVSKGLGLTEPEHAVRPVININIAHIRAEQSLVSADDEAAQKAIDVTTTQD